MLMILVNQLKDHADEKNSVLDDGDGGTGDGQDELNMEIDEDVVYKPLVLGRLCPGAELGFFVPLGWNEYVFFPLIKYFF
ncbi:hypothetical protein Syun_031332 [Stephania yunnanensis]|uniref:Uncharacterized protein n=1 Tax=Stephania yunnanensis TaxID=152371 RepID=A0AAP0DTM7_9MAGN